jgi:acyl-CoA dehydrogenase
MQLDSQATRPEIVHSDEQALLLAGAGDLFAKRWDFGAVRRAMTTKTGYDAALYRELAQLGWLGLALPAAYGGSELSPAALVDVFEPMGRVLYQSPFLASTLAAQALLHAGNASQKQAWLPRIASGEVVVTVALTEPSGSFDLSRIEASAVAQGEMLTLSGTKTFVLEAQHADVVIAAVRCGGRLALVLLSRDMLADRVQAEVLIDETRRSARVRLDGLQVPASALLDGGDAERALRSVERLSWLLSSAEMCGGAEGVMQLTLEYLKTRKQFGKLIGSYQALKHTMVDIMCAIESGRSLLYHAATAFDADDADSDAALRMAKAQLGETFAFAADRAVQFHGAMGFTYECHAQLFFRRAQWSQYTFGDSVFHRKRLAQALWP